MLQLHAPLSIRFNVLQVVQPLIITPIEHTLIEQSLQNSDNKESTVPINLATQDILDEDRPCRLCWATILVALTTQYFGLH